MIPRILLTDTGRAPFAARLAIGFSKVGCNIAVVCPSGHPLLKTRAVAETFRYGGVRPLESLLTAIEKARPDIIVPCDDRGVQHLHELYALAITPGIAQREMAELIQRSLGRPESYPIVSARSELLRIACDERLPVPETLLLNNLDDLKCWHAGKSFPVVLKADGTSGGRGVKLAHDHQQAEHFFLELTHEFSAMRAIKRLCMNRDSFWLRPYWKGARPAIIAQSYIEGRPANCAVIAWKGNTLAGIAVEAVETQEPTGPACIVRVVENSQMMLAAERIAHRLGLSGFFGLDFVIEQGTGTAYLIEMNPRCTPLCHLQLGKGRDLIGQLWSHIAGEPAPPPVTVTQNELIAYFPQARSCRKDLLESSFEDIPEGERDLIKELLDPWPERTLLNRAINRVRHFVPPREYGGQGAYQNNV